MASTPYPAWEPNVSGTDSFVQFRVKVLKDKRLSNGVKVFCAQLLVWDWGNGCWLTDKQLAHELGISERSVWNHTKALEKAGHLWVFEDREGMKVRLVVRPGHSYPKPPGLGKSLPRKKISKPSAPNMVVHAFEVHESTTTHHESRYPVPPPELPQAPVVAPAIEKTILTPEITQTPESTPKAQPPAYKPHPDILKALTGAGVASRSAIDLSRNFLPTRILSGIDYVQNRMDKGYSVENPGGYIRRAIEEGWKESVLPKPSKSAAFKPSRSSSPSYPLPKASKPAETAAFKAFENAKNTSPHTQSWNSALSAMHNPANLDAWVSPAAVCSLKNSVYIASITLEACTLIASSDYVVSTVRQHLDQIHSALSLSGISSKMLIVSIHSPIPDGSKDLARAQEVSGAASRPFLPD